MPQQWFNPGWFDHTQENCTSPTSTIHDRRIFPLGALPQMRTTKEHRPRHVTTISIGCSLPPLQPTATQLPPPNLHLFPQFTTPIIPYPLKYEPPTLFWFPKAPLPPWCDTIRWFPGKNGPWLKLLWGRPLLHWQVEAKFFPFWVESRG